jgi:hypothetical protein
MMMLNKVNHQSLVRVTTSPIMLTNLMKMHHGLRWLVRRRRKQVFYRRKQMFLLEGQELPSLVRLGKRREKLTLFINQS